MSIDRLIEIAKQHGLEVEDVEPGEGGVFEKQKDGSLRRVEADELCAMILGAGKEDL